MQEEHIIKAKKNNADIFIASVSKHADGVKKIHALFSIMAKKYQMPILMVNSLGASDNFIAAGGSAAWDKKGNLVLDGGILDENYELIIIPN